MTRSFLISARRSPVAPRNGALAHLSIEDLARPVLLETLQDAGIAPQDVGELIVANSLGAGGNPARIVALHAGLPETVAGLSVDRQCAGGLDAILLADAMIRAGSHDIVVAGGVESYSRRPLRFRTFADGREPLEYHQAQFTPWPDRDPDMADAANLLARKYGIGKSVQDEWAVLSHQKAMAAQATTGAAEIIPIADVYEDTFTRNLTQKHCDRARPVSGNITAANMAVAADGAAFVVLVSDAYKNTAGLEGVELVAGKTVGGDPELPGVAPVDAIRHVLNISAIQADDLICAEIMEAFAVQAIVCQQGAGIPHEIVNLRGGALARGHPISASGAILAVSLFHRLKESKGVGLAAIAAAGGLGTAMVARSG